MDSVAKRDPEDSAKIKAIEQKLLANPEIAKLIDELGTTATDANNLVRGLLQASVTRGLEAEMDAHLGYSKGDREDKAIAGGDNYRNGSYVKRLIRTTAQSMSPSYAIARVRFTHYGAERLTPVNLCR